MHFAKVELARVMILKKIDENLAANCAERRRSGATQQRH